MSLTDAQRISLLHLLHRVPEKPFKNPLPSAPIQDGYELSFRQELHLTHTLAFISNTREDTDYVSAICVHQNSHLQQLEVLLAVNKLGCDAGTGVLKNLSNGFKGIFKVLSRVTTDDDEDNKHVLLTAVVAMCETRIKSRLRFGHDNRKRSRQPFKSALQQAINAVTSNVVGSADINLPVDAIVDNLRSVIHLTEAWAKHQVTSRLVDQVNSVYNLSQLNGFAELINSIPNRQMAPSSRTNLVNIINKVARYKQCALYLHKLAKGCDLVRCMRPVTVDLAPEAFRRSTQDKELTTLGESLARLGGLHGNMDLQYICRLLNKTVPEADAQFIQQTKRTSSSSKVHAEIQLLQYCDQKKTFPPPRVVCSSKDACYLCNAFISAHGNMYTPRCHGKLWPGWRLPAIGVSPETKQTFSTLLEDRISEGIRVLLQRREKTVYPDPAESTMITLSSLATGTNVSSASIEAGSSEITSVHSVDAQVEEIPSGSSSDSPPDTIYQERTRYVETELIRGQPVSGTVQVGNASTLYTARSLEIQIENPQADPTAPAGSARSFRVHWLRYEERETFYGAKESPVIDIDSLSGERICELNEFGRICLAAQDEMVELTFN